MESILTRVVWMLIVFAMTWIAAMLYNPDLDSGTITWVGFVAGFVTRMPTKGN